MSDRHIEIARKYLDRAWEALQAFERRAIERLVSRKTPPSLSQADADDRTFGERVADRVASFGGSWTFIILFGTLLVIWIAINSWVLAQMNRDAFDPYPYMLLNFFLSMLAALQAPVIMMSQNRQGEIDRKRAEHDYEINLKAELEIVQLHEKLDELRLTRWDELLAIQEKQITILNELAKKAS